MNKKKLLFAFFFPGTTKNERIAEYRKVFQDFGCFEYSADVFSFHHNDFIRSLKWDEITRLVAYKANGDTIDHVEMQIFYGDEYFTITEEMPGWFQFIIKTKEIFPSIPPEWENEILFPVFAENRTIIYSKEVPPP